MNEKAHVDFIINTHEITSLFNERSLGMQLAKAEIVQVWPFLIRFLWKEHVRMCDKWIFFL